MPGFDGTGPRGQGAMTGGGRGRCNCFYATGLPSWMRAKRGMQAFGGFGRAVSKDDQLEMLKSQAEFLKQQLEDAQARIQAMASQQEADKK